MSDRLQRSRVPVLPTVLFADANEDYRSMARDALLEGRNATDLRTVADGTEVLAFHIQGPIVDKVLDEADKHGADLIVVGSHGHGALFEFLVGSVTSGILRASKCPVLVVPAR